MSEKFKYFNDSETMGTKGNENNSNNEESTQSAREKRYSISKSGRFKQIQRQREALDTSLFVDDKEKQLEKDISRTSTTSLHKKSYTEIENWIENSFRQTLEDYKTVRKRNSAPTNPTRIDGEGHIETAF